MPLTNEQFGEVMRVYQDRRLRALEGAAEREREILTKLPAYKSLDEERLRLSMERIRSSFAGESEKAKADQIRLDYLTREKEEVLTEAGYPADYLQPRWECALCEDTGFVDGQKCRCFKKTVMERLYRNSPLWKRVESERFADFSLEWYSEEPLAELQGKSPRQIAAQNLEAAKDFAAKFGTEGGNLLLIGPVGTGKTFLCNAIAGTLMEEGFAVLYMTAAEYFDAAAAKAFGEEEDGSDLDEALESADLLILDDLGMEVPNKFSRAALFRTVNERGLAGRSTVISTNLNMNQLSEQYSERVVSRLLGGYRILRFAGEDIRQLKLRAKPGKTRK